MAHLPSVSGSREGETRCTNRSLAKIHAHGRNWAELSVGVFVSQVKKLLKGREIRTPSILEDAQRYMPALLFVLPLLKYRREGLQEVYSDSVTGVLGSTCRFQTIVTCPLLCSAIWQLNKPSPWGHRNPHIQSPTPSGFCELKSNTRSPVPLTKAARSSSLSRGAKSPLPSLSLRRRPPRAAGWQPRARRALTALSLSLSPGARKADDGGGGERAREAAGAALVLRKVWSRSPAPERRGRYVVVSGTPEKILEHLLSDLHLEAAQDKETETLLDDFLLTYTVFMTTDDLCQALLRHYCAKNHQGKEDDSDVSCRKRKVLHLVSQWTSLYKDWLHEDEHLKQFLKTIYRNVLDDVYEYPVLEKDLKEFQKILGMHRRHTVDEYSPHRKNKTFFHQFSVKENWLQHRGTVNETEEIFCRVYITEHSYVSVKAQVSTSAQEILKIVAEKIQYPEEELALVTVSFSGEKHELQPNDLAISKSLESSSRMFVYRKDLTDSLSPFSENEELQQRSVRILGINTWDLALELTNFDWSLFNAIHEQELIYFTFSRQGSAENTENLSLLLQRCNEVQLWVATEILLCSQLCKRVQLVKKFIKIAAHCKAQRNLNSFFAIVMGLNTASVSRLSQTWEKIPGKFKKLFTELESLTDPSLNHKAYRDAFKKMKSPKIPFMPLLLKDVTFIHEGNKTFLDNLVNFEKLHMIADTVRSLRHCRNNQFGNEVPSKEHHELKPYIHHLHVIDNQQALFELSHRIEPRA